LDSDKLTLDGKSVSGIAFDDTDTYTATFASTGVSDRIAGGKLDMTVDADGKFTFADGEVADTDISEYAKCI
jgi:hypothetical protein